MSVTKGSRFERGFRLGPEGDDGTHLRDTSGWPEVRIGASAPVKLENLLAALRAAEVL